MVGLKGRALEGVKKEQERGQRELDGWQRELVGLWGGG